MRSKRKYLVTINAKNLSQTLVEGYYVLVGSDLKFVIITVTDVAVIHYFKIKLPSTRGRDT